MSRLRIVCKGEPIVTKNTLAGLLYPRLNARPAIFSDLEIFAVDDGGKEIPITNITRIEWSVAQGVEPARAVVHFVDVDIDVEGEIVK